MDGLVGIRQKDLAAGVRMVPAHRLPVRRITPGAGDYLGQLGLIVGRERERRAQSVLAIDGFVAGNRDFRPPARQRKKRVHHRQPDIVQHARRILNLERTPRHRPRAQCDFDARLHAILLIVGDCRAERTRLLA